jgi:hypothetical protein
VDTIAFGVGVRKVSWPDAYWKVTNGTGAVEVLSASGSGRLSVKTHGLSGKYLVIAASDPAGRIDKLTLRL